MPWLGARVDHLSRTLAELGFTTHLFFVGDPARPGEEIRPGGKLILHRWCQWMSEYYPGRVYDGENDKLSDVNESIPWFVRDRKLEQQARRQGILDHPPSRVGRQVPAARQQDGAAVGNGRPPETGLGRPAGLARPEEAGLVQACALAT